MRGPMFAVGVAPTRRPSCRCLTGLHQPLHHGSGRTLPAVHHADRVNPDVRVLEPCDALAAAVAVRKQLEGVAGDLIQDGIVVMAGERHR